MKRLYLYFLNLRVWLAYLHLHKLGFRKMIDEADARTLLQLARDDIEGQRLFVESIKVGLMAVAILSLWLVFGFRSLEPVRVIVSSPQTPAPAPGLPAEPAP